MGVTVEEEDFADEVRVDIFECVGEVFFCYVLICFEFGLILKIHTGCLSSQRYCTEIIDIHFVDLK